MYLICLLVFSVVCDRPANISDGWHNGSSSYNESLKGVPIGTAVKYTCNSGFRLFAGEYAINRTIKCMRGGVYFPPTPNCVNCKFKLIILFFNHPIVNYDFISYKFKSFFLNTKKI